jgi:hypothetical protein
MESEANITPDEIKHFDVEDNLKGLVKYHNGAKVYLRVFDQDEKQIYAYAKFFFPKELCVKCPIVIDPTSSDFDFLKGRFDCLKPKPDCCICFEEVKSSGNMLCCHNDQVCRKCYDQISRCPLCRISFNE